MGTGHLAGPVTTPPLPDGGGIHIITLSVFLSPMPPGTHTITIRGGLFGDAIAATYPFAFLKGGVHIHSRGRPTVTVVAFRREPWVFSLLMRHIRRSGVRPRRRIRPVTHRSPSVKTSERGRDSVHVDAWHRAFHRPERSIAAIAGTWDQRRKGLSLRRTAAFDNAPVSRQRRMPLDLEDRCHPVAAQCKEQTPMGRISIRGIILALGAVSLATVTVTASPAAAAKDEELASTLGFCGKQCLSCRSPRIRLRAAIPASTLGRSLPRSPHPTLRFRARSRPAPRCS